MALRSTLNVVLINASGGGAEASSSAEWNTHADTQHAQGWAGPGQRDSRGRAHFATTSRTDPAQPPRVYTTAEVGEEASNTACHAPVQSASPADLTMPRATDGAAAPTDCWNDRRRTERSTPYGRNSTGAVSSQQRRGILARMSATSRSCRARGIWRTTQHTDKRTAL